jgi:uncharacterized protein YwgA
MFNGRTTPKSAFRAAASAVAIGAMLCVSSSPAQAWGFKTHVWIAQQVLNDAQDGSVEIGGRNYRVAPHVLAAIRAEPDRFRAGALGPDIYPDPIVGQTTTHPGVEDGWAADEWLGYLASRAEGHAEVAFTYGFASHFAGDIFAHSYVNGYAGAVFNLLDGESDVERRHVAIEKYLDLRMPPATDHAGNPIKAGDIKAPSSFLRDALILDAPPAREYRKVMSSAHLAAMYAVYRNVREVEKEAEKLEKRLDDYRLPFANVQLEIAADLARARHAVEAAKGAVQLEKAMLELRRAEQRAAEHLFTEAQRIIKEHPEKINAQQELLAVQAKAAVDAGTELIRITAQAQQVISDAERSISNLRGEIASWACELIFWDAKKRKKCKKKIRRANDAISNLGSTITGQKARISAAQKALEVAEANRDGTKRTIDRMTKELTDAQANIANGTLQAAIDAHKAAVRLQEEKVQLEEKALAEAEKLAREFDSKLEEINKKLQDLAHAGVLFTGLKVVLHKWRTDMAFATEEYIKTSDSVGRALYSLEGNPIEEYLRWVRCYGPTFMGTPKEVGQINCFAGDSLKNVHDEINRFIDRLPEIVRWMVAPSRELQRFALNEMEPEIKKAKRAFGDTNPNADLLMLLSDPAYADRDKLKDVLRTDTSRKRLLKLPAGADMIDADAHMTNGLVDPSKLAPLNHSVVLAKLALLGPDELNRLISDLAPAYASPASGQQVYTGTGLKPAIFNHAVRSLDGNHQWQAYGLPHPRRSGNLDHPKRHKYGRDPHKGEGAGLRIWVDPYLREKVFFKLFPSQIIGALGSRPELQAPRYPFPSCPAYPYPSTQDASGKIVDRDLTCVQLSSPASTSDLRFTNLEQYKARYFGCDASGATGEFWSVLGSHSSLEGAQQRVASIRAQFPDMAVEARRFGGKGSRYLVVNAACVDTERSSEAKDIAMLRRLTAAPYVIRHRLSEPDTAAPPATPLPR